MSADREALVSMLAGAGVWLDRCPEIADTILVSGFIAEVKADALAEARDDIKARIATFRQLNADDQYMNALNDAWGLVANRERAARKEVPV